MPSVNGVNGEVDSSFAQIANADIDSLLKKLTQDEKIALLTGKCPCVY